MWDRPQRWWDPKISQTWSICLELRKPSWRIRCHPPVSKHIRAQVIEAVFELLFQKVLNQNGCRPSQADCRWEDQVGYWSWATNSSRHAISATCAPTELWTRAPPVLDQMRSSRLRVQALLRDRSKMDYWVPAGWCCSALKQIACTLHCGDQFPQDRSSHPPDEESLWCHELLSHPSKLRATGSLHCEWVMGELSNDSGGILRITICGSHDGCSQEEIEPSPSRTCWSWA